MPLALFLGLTLAAQAAAPGAGEARRLARRSVLEYDTGDYDAALADIARAYELDPRPGFLFNLGQCHRALGHYEKAALAFRSYLRAVPRAKNRSQVERLLAEMEAKAKSQLAAAPPPVAARAPPPPAPPRAESAAAVAPAPPIRAAPAAAVSAPVERGGPPPATWWIGGGGVAAALAGAALVVLADGTLGGDRTTAGPNGATVHSLSAQSYGSAVTQGNVGDGLLLAGGALVVAAAVVALAGGGR